MIREMVKFADTKTAKTEDFGAPGLTAHLLSKDTTGNTFTVVLDIPAGFKGPAPERQREQSEEIFVLDGDVQVAGTELAKGDYRFCPPGHALGGISGSKGGARVFLKRGFTGSDRKLIERLKWDDMEWTARGEGTNVSEFTLLSGGTSGTMSRIFRVPVGWHGMRDGGHFHTSSEEVFVIEGDVANDERSVYNKECYLFRPGGVMHGFEERSKNGCTMLCFFEEGPLDFTYAGDMKDPHSVPWE